MAVAIAAAFAIFACGQQASTPAPAASTAPGTPSTSSKAADLRTKLDILLGEHLILASKATGAALAGNNDSFAAYGKLLGTNGTDIGAMIGAAYGQQAQDQFNQIWSAHDGFFVDYTKGVAANDDAAKSKAVDNLTNQYVPQFTTFLAGATDLPADAIKGLVTDHVLQTKAVVDDQAAKNYTKEYQDIDTAYQHMQQIGDALAPAIAKKTGKFDGDASSKAAGFRATLNVLLQEHLYMATAATGAALAGRTDEFTAAADALNKNGTTIGGAIGMLYGQPAQDQFNQIWSAHNGFFVDYTKGVAANDATMKQKGVDELTTQYIPQFSMFLAGATGLPQDAIAGLTKDHVLTTKQVVDDQGAKNYAQAANDDRTAAQHMEMIGDPLASAIVAKLPAKFQ
jgi:uncharacterized membrane protein YqgA involved in biofilm formation